MIHQRGVRLPRRDRRQRLGRRLIGHDGQVGQPPRPLPRLQVPLRAEFDRQRATGQVGHSFDSLRTGPFDGLRALLLSFSPHRAHHQHLPGVEVDGRVCEIGHARGVDDERGDDDVHAVHRQRIVEAVVGEIGDELNLDPFDFALLGCAHGRPYPLCQLARQVHVESDQRPVGGDGLERGEAGVHPHAQHAGLAHAIPGVVGTTAGGKINDK